MVTVRSFGIVVAAASLLAAAAGCGDDHSSPQPGPETPFATAASGAAPTPTVAATLPPPLASPTGESTAHVVQLPALANLPTRTIRASDSLSSLKSWGSDDEVAAVPVAADGNRFVVQKIYAKHPDEHAVAYELWNSSTGQSTPLWTVPAGKLDEFTVADGGWVATIETGYSLPLARWSLLLHNLDSGEVRTVAISDERVPPLARNVQLGPAGFAPLPAIGGGRLAWVEFFVNDSGSLGKRLQVYDLGRQQIATIDAVADASKGDLESPSFGGPDLAWLRRDESAQPVIKVRGLMTGFADSYEIGGDPYSAALSADGSMLAWDDTQYAQRGTRAKYALNRETGVVTRYSETKGWGTDVGGNAVSWAPWENEAGFYDMRAGVLYHVDLQGAKTVVARVMGSWYVWQQTRDTGQGIQESESTFYFMKLP